MKDLLFKCCCGCRSQASVSPLKDGCVIIDTRESGRHSWKGVVLNKEDTIKLKNFIDYLIIN